MAKAGKQQDEKITTSIYLTKQMCGEIDKKADREHISRNEQIRKYIEKGLAIESYEENIDLITAIIHQEIDASIKVLGNRLAGMINRMTIISAAGYYANIALIADLIDTDRYSSFEKIERLARKRALAYANMKSGDALKAFGYVFSTYRTAPETDQIIQRQFFYNKEFAGQDFAKRSGLVDEKAIFTETELMVLHSNLVKLSMQSEHINNDEMLELGRMIEKIEEVVPELQDRDYDFDFAEEFRQDMEEEIGG